MSSLLVHIRSVLRDVHRGDALSDDMKVEFCLRMDRRTEELLREG